jgi:hypothetical protein
MFYLLKNIEIHLMSNFRFEKIAYEKILPISRENLLDIQKLKDLFLKLYQNFTIHYIH